MGKKKDEMEDMNDELEKQNEALQAQLDAQREFYQKQANLANQKQEYAQTKAEVTGAAQGDALKALNRQAPVNFTDVEEKNPDSLLY
jgi:hypothetical protein